MDRFQDLWSYIVSLRLFLLRLLSFIPKLRDLYQPFYSHFFPLKPFVYKQNKAKQNTLRVFTSFQEKAIISGSCYSLDISRFLNYNVKY